MRRIPSVRRRCREHSRLCPSPGEQFPASPWSSRAGAPFPAAFQRLRPGTETDQDFLWDIFLIRNLNKKRQPWARCGDAPPSGRAPSLLQGSPGAGGRAGIPRNRCQPCASAPQPRSLALPPGILPHPGAPWPPPPPPQLAPGGCAPAHSPGACPRVPPGPGSRLGRVQDGASHSLAPPAAAAGVGPFIVWEGAGREYPGRRKHAGTSAERPSRWEGEREMPDTSHPGKGFCLQPRRGKTRACLCLSRALIPAAELGRESWEFRGGGSTVPGQDLQPDCG